MLETIQSDPVAGETLPPSAVCPGLLVSQGQAWRYINVSRTKWFALRAAAKLPAPINLLGTVYWRTEDLRQWVSRYKAMKGAGRRQTATANGD